LDKSVKFVKEALIIVLIAVSFVVPISLFLLNEYWESNLASAFVEATGGGVNIVQILRLHGNLQHRG
jgi:hypothetical protein